VPRCSSHLTPQAACRPGDNPRLPAACHLLAPVLTFCTLLAPYWPPPNLHLHMQTAGLLQAAADEGGRCTGASHAPHRPCAALPGPGGLDGSGWQHLEASLLRRWLATTCLNHGGGQAGKAYLLLR
jgi:hypothetical protein